MKVEMTWASNKLNTEDQMGVSFSWDSTDEPKFYYFGNITLLVDSDGKPKIDSEHMGKDFVKEVLCKWIDEAELKE